MSPPTFFEAFCAEQATKKYELSYEEIQAAIVDGEHDGGIDSFTEPILFDFGNICWQVA